MKKAIVLPNSRRHTPVDLPIPKTIRDFLGSIALFFLLVATAHAQVPPPTCDVFGTVLQTRKDPSAIEGFTDGVVAYLHDTESCGLNTGDVWHDDYGHGLKCDDGSFASATGAYGASLAIDYTFTLANADTDTSPASPTADSVTITQEGQTLSDDEYDTITQDYHHYDFSLDARSFPMYSSTDKAINRFESIIGEVTIQYIDGKELEIGSFSTAGYDTTKLLIDGTPETIRIDSLQNSGSNDFETHLVAQESVEINTLELSSSANSYISLEAPKVVINSLASTNNNNTILIKADEIDIGDITLAQNNDLIIQPLTPGANVTFHTNSLATSSSAHIILDGGDYYFNSLTVPGTGTGERTIIASDTNQIVNLFVNNDLTLENNPGINSVGNDGNFGDLPAANFRLFVNGNLTTGGGGTTFNAMIYVEGATELGSPTYLKGALSSYETIRIGNNSQFYKDPSIDEAGWGLCPIVQPTFDNRYTCGIFDSVLVSYRQIDMQQNDVFNSCTISVKDYNFNEHSSGQPNVTCYESMDTSKPCQCTGDYCSEDKTCTIVPEPKNRYDHEMVTTTVTTTTSTSEDVTFTDLAYGNYIFTNAGSNANSQQIYFNPQETYIDNSTPVMMLGDFQFDGNGQTLTFEGGDYYFKSFKIDKDTNGNINQINLCVKDDVRLFISGDFVYSGNHINDSECGGKLFVYVEGNAEIDASGGGSTDLPIFLYTKGDVTIDPSGDASLWNGGIIAEGAINVTGDNFNFYYNDSAADFGLGECPMCYADITIGGLSMNFMNCGGFSIVKDIRVPIFSSTTVENATVDEAHDQTIFSFSFMSTNDVLDTDGNHLRDAIVHSSGWSAGAMGMDMTAFGDKAITYPLDNPYGPADATKGYNQLHSSSLFSMSFDPCKWYESLAYVAHYDVGDRHYDVVLSRCDVAMSGTPYATGPFDAWDVGHGVLASDGTMQISDFNISTKLASRSFNLTIGSLDASHTKTETKEGISQVCFKPVSIAEDGSYSYLPGAWQTFDANATPQTEAEFTVDSAVRRVGIVFRFFADYNGTHYLLKPPPLTLPCTGDDLPIYHKTDLNILGWRETLSTDSFAVRPVRFAITLSPTPVEANATLDLEIKALREDENNATGYNALMPLTVRMSDSTRLCPSANADFNVTSVTFRDGGAYTTAQFGDIGEVNLTMIDHEWVDAATLGGSAECNASTECITTYGHEGVDASGVVCCDIEGSLNHLVVGFDRFQVTYAFQNADTLHNFTYLHAIDNSDTRMAASLDLTLQAVDRSGETVRNYTDQCYAQDTEISLALAPFGIQPADALSKILLVDLDHPTKTRDFALPASGMTLDYNASIFTNGEAALHFKLNFDRQSNKSAEPFDLNITGIDINDSTVSGATSATQGVHFFYGRLHAPDYKTTQSSIVTPIYVEVYASTAPQAGWKESVDDVNWWINADHAAADGNITALAPYEGYTATPDSSVVVENFDGTSFVNGADTTPTVRYTGTTRPHTTQLRMGTQPWLMYHKYITDPAKMLYYNVEFYGGSGWAGVGQKGETVTDSNASSERIEW